MLLLQTLYNIINLIASWFAIVSKRNEATSWESEADGYVRSGQFLLILCDLVLVLGVARVPHALDSVLKLGYPGIAPSVGCRNATLLMCSLQYLLASIVIASFLFSMGNKPRS